MIAKIITIIATILLFILIVRIVGCGKIYDRFFDDDEEIT